MPARVRQTIAEDIIARFVGLWSQGDLDTAFTLVHDDCEYSLHLSDDLIAIGGVKSGRATIEPALRQIREVFDYLVWRPIKISERDADVRVQLEFLYRHIPSGELLGGNCRFLFRVREGLITRVEEFHDRAKVAAFLRLVGAQGHPAEPTSQAGALAAEVETASPHVSTPRAVTLA
ncbi:MAG: nuclear transport factor 2 family protein [Hyphomicrobiaceae bacterium]|nr:nuclear transport factor 2 family protein [Hyphomicrobiaceae bacterium]